MQSITPIELKTIKQVLDLLNEQFPPSIIPTRKWKNNLLVDCQVQESNHFTAYKFNVWWLMIDSYWLYKDYLVTIEQCCEYFKQETGVDCHVCHVHPVYVKEMKEQAKRKLQIFVGQVNW